MNRFSYPLLICLLASSITSVISDTVLAAEVPVANEATHSSHDPVQLPSFHGVVLAEGSQNSGNATSHDSRPVEDTNDTVTYSKAPPVAAQMTSVSQLSDVQPTDWAFQALQSLVERYGCIAGYPDGTYRGSRAMTRYEFAAGLNACLNRVNELIAAATSDLVRKEDLATLQRLQEEFATELSTLRGRVAVLETHTTDLEAHQFSTTTKLVGEALFSLNGFTGGSTLRDGRGNIIANNTASSNATFTDRVRINFNTSFTGGDLLNVRFQPNNTVNFAGNTATGTNESRVGFDGNTNNAFVISRLFYRFFAFGYTRDGKGHAVPRARIFIGPVNTTDDFINTISPYDFTGLGAISRFGIRSPIYRVSGTNASVGFDYNITPQIQLSGLYTVPDPGNPAAKSGFINGTFGTTGQLLVRPTDKLDVALTYVRAYLSNGSLNTGTGSRLADNIGNGQPTDADSYGVEVNWRISPKFRFTGWANYTAANQVRGRRGAAETFNYLGFLGLLDLFSKGNELVLGFGQPPKLSGEQGTGVGGSERSTSYHIEAFYRARVGDHLLITPGAFYIINPESNSSNSNVFVGILRSTFTF